MASHDGNAMHVLDVSAAAAAAAGGAASAAILVEPARPVRASGGWGPAEGFGGGVLLALPALFAAVLLRRRARRGARDHAK